ncbi:hypothetical protein AAGV03_08180, partial [Bifidobacterium animalis subsp. lactis]
ITPKLLTCVEGAIVKPSMHIEKPLDLDALFFVPTRSISVLLLLSLRKLLENQALTSDKQLEREDGGSSEVGFEGK